MSSPLLIGLSGPSSSGKTTIARLVRSLLGQRVLILHEDDFYRAENELPSRGGFLDWDCAGAIDEAAFIRALSYIKQHGTLPPDLDSKEDRNEAGPNPVADADLARLRADLAAGLNASVSASVNGDADTGLDPNRVVVLVDGFLLFGVSVPRIRNMFDLRLMLRAPYAAAKDRRERRAGYVTLEGFWQDPPGYVDAVVWPGYVDEHAFLFKDGNVDGEVNEAAANRVNVRIVPGDVNHLDLTRMLEWVLDQIKEALRE